MNQLSAQKLVEVPAYVHGLNPESRPEREAILRETIGVLSDSDGIAFEQALVESRRIEP